VLVWCVAGDLFSHNVQQEITESMWMQHTGADGILGRLISSVSAGEHGFKSQSFSINGNRKAVEGLTPATILDQNHGVVRYKHFDELADQLRQLARPSASVISDTYATALNNALDSTQELSQVLEAISLSTAFPESQIGKQLKQVATVMKAELGNEREVFQVGFGSFDTHRDSGGVLATKLGEIDAALQAFKAEMEMQDKWKDVVLIEASDFGRTLTPNAEGTDHAWGGNYFVVGGAVNGSKMLGHYPESLADRSTWDVGRGRVLPTTPWEAPWNAISRWFGVSESQMPNVLPNVANFGADQLFVEEDLLRAA